MGGAAGGALAGFTCETSLVVTAAVTGAAVAAGVDIAVNAIQGNDLLDGVDKAVLGGGVGGGVGYAAGVAIGNKVQAAKNVAQVKATSNQIGKHGEDAVKSVYDIGGKTKISVNGRTSIPDGMKDGILSEVKNTKTQSFTRQLRDFSNYADSNGLRMDLYTRPDTKLSTPLQNAIECGKINLRTIPE